ncbi:MAG: nickel-responsive transcriptional regulator NikR [Kiritimatiellia bacterium]
MRRFSVSMNNELVERLDIMTREKGFANRSQAVSSIVEQGLTEYEGNVGNGDIVGTITLVYDHHRRNLQSTLTDIQHKSGNLVISTMHVHLKSNICLEVLAVRGRVDKVRKFADSLVTVKGVHHGCLTVADSSG